MPAYISEFSQAGATQDDFVEIAVSTGTDLSGYSIYVYKNTGEISQGPLSLGSVQGTFAGKDVYVVNDSTAGFSGLADSYGIALVNDLGEVLQFISSDGTPITAVEGPAKGGTSKNVGTHENGKSLQSDDGGAHYYQQTSPNEGSVPCYALGTMIDTPTGPRGVETLRMGDLVLTRDHGAQPILWTRSAEQPLDGLERDRQPVMIGAGALGPGTPAKDLIVSPQHRILVGEAAQLDACFTAKAFAPAKSLTDLPGIRHMMGKTRVAWVHFACARHEIVRANGCWSESLLLGPMVLKGLRAAERRALSDIFKPAPNARGTLNGPPARDSLTVGAVRRRINSISKGKRRLIQMEKRDSGYAVEEISLERTRDNRPSMRARGTGLR